MEMPDARSSNRRKKAKTAMNCPGNRSFVNGGCGARQVHRAAISREGRLCGDVCAVAVTCSNASYRAH
eukprot:1126381-Pyramimonas_sp.AAC.1